MSFVTVRVIFYFLYFSLNQKQVVVTSIPCYNLIYQCVESIILTHLLHKLGDEI
jgi:hypothetical protein